MNRYRGDRGATDGWSWRPRARRARAVGRAVGLAAVLPLLVGLAPRVPPAPAAALRVLSVRMVRIPNARILSLSPDGRWLVAEAQPQGNQAPRLCLYATASLARGRCIAEPNGSIDPRSVAWSPDGTRLAWTENWPQYLQDSHLWVWRVAAGAPREIVDDGVVGSLMQPHPTRPGAKPLPVAVPAWSPDGRSLVFARSSQASHTTALYRVSAAGGTPRPLLTVAPHQELALWYGLRDTGTHLLYTVDSPVSTDPRNALYIADEDGAHARVLVPRGRRKGPLFVLAVTPDGRTALVYDAIGAGQYTPPLNVSYYALVDVATGRVAPLPPGPGPTRAYRSPAGAVLSPDGSTVLYAYRTAASEPRIVVRALHGTREHALAVPALHGQPVGDFDIGLGFYWAADNTVYLASNAFQGVLLRLGTR